MEVVNPLSTIISIYPLQTELRENNIRFAVIDSALTLKRFVGIVKDNTEGVYHLEIEVNENLTTGQKDKINGYFSSCYIKYS